MTNSKKEKSDPVPEYRLVLENPHTNINFFKRLLAFLFGFGGLAAYFQVVLDAIKEEYILDLSVEIHLIAVPTGAALILYSLFRNRVYKECFVELHKDRIKARLRMDAHSSNSDYDSCSSYLVYGRLPEIYSTLKNLLNPKYFEFDFAYKNLKSIEVQVTQVRLHGQYGLTQEIPLGNLDYTTLREAKVRFQDAARIVSQNAPKETSS